MVPVLSNNKISTSPAASIARPLIAITFSLFKRLIPAIPIDETNAPIVVGAKQTSKAMIVVNAKAEPLPTSSLENFVKGSNVAETTKKIIVNIIKIICNPISFGVFLRSVPSTIEIILSKNDSPFSAVTLITK